MIYMAQIVLQTLFGEKRGIRQTLTILCSLINLAGGHGLGDQALEGQLLLLKVLGGGVLNLELGHGVAESRLDLLLVATLQLHGHAGVRNDLLNTGDVRLKLLAGLKLLGESLVAGLELGSVLNHLVDLGAGQLADSVGDGDVGRATGGLLSSGDLQDTVDIDLEHTLKSGLTGTHGRERSKGELAQGGVVSAVGTLTLVNRELNGALVVNDGGEGTLLDGGDSLTTVDNRGEDVTLHGNTEGKGNNVEEEKVLGLGGGGLSGEDTGLDGSTVGNGLIGVDALLELLAVEEVAQELLDTGNTGGTTDKDDLVDSGFVNLGISEDTVDWGGGGTEEVLAEFLETSTSDGGVEINTLEERVDLDGGLGG